MSRPYVIWCPQVPFSRCSGGVQVLHKLVHDLNAYGMEAYLSNPWGNPEWNVPHWKSTAKDFIAVYPEIVYDNPLRAPHVVRWILYTADTIFPKEDMIVPYMEMYNNYGLSEDHVLMLPCVELDAFNDPHLPRKGRMYYVGSKGLRLGCRRRLEEVDQWPELQRPFTETSVSYAYRMQTCELLYTYDNMTMLCECARLCGCPVVIVHDSPFTKEDYRKHEMGMEGLGITLAETDWAMSTINSATFLDRYLALIETYKRRLVLFIERTQAMP
jgi:hypothetical protein